MFTGRHGRDPAGNRRAYLNEGSLMRAMGMRRSIDLHGAAWAVLAACLALALFLGISEMAHAGTTGTEFTTLYEKLTGWMQGYLGRVVSAIFILIGVIAGATKGSVMGFVVGVAAGVGLYLAPSVIDATVTATLPLL